MKILKAVFKDKKLLHGALMTLLILVVLRVFYSIPTPGINTEYFKEIIESNSALGFFNVLTGDALSNMSIMMLNITPYITASIIIQLLGNVFNKIREMEKGMRDEQKKLERITVYLGIVLALIEGVAVALGYGKQGLFIEYTWYWVAIAAVVWTAGAAACALLGKYIHEKYDFNGTSLILLMNILASYPSDAKTIYEVLLSGKDIGELIAIAVLVLLLIVALFSFTYWVQESEKTVYINYTNKSNFSGGSQQGTLPLKLCPGSVVPIIFASSLMTTPVLIASAFTSTDALWAKILTPSCWFVPGDWLPTVGAIVYILLIFGFSYYYTNITMDPKDVAQNIKKNGGIIAGIRPGKPTENYLRRQMKGVIAIGAIALIIIAMVPILLSGLLSISRTAFLGTSVIITVGVIVELKNSLRAKTQQMAFTPIATGRGLF